MRGGQVQPVRELDNMPTIVHFEIPAEDIERSKKFYSELFGWKIEKFPGETPAGEYWMLTITDDKGNKVLGGGMHKRMFPEQQITNYIDVKSVDEYSSRLEKLGGKVVRTKRAVPGMGYFAFCLDTENNSFAIWETNENAR
jgi:predicted enzyme related to lactoylglutathione lyase